MKLAHKKKNHRFVHDCLFVWNFVKKQTVYNSSQTLYKAIFDPGTLHQQQSVSPFIYILINIMYLTVSCQNMWYCRSDNSSLYLETFSYIILSSNTYQIRKLQLQVTHLMDSMVLLKLFSTCGRLLMHLQQTTFESIVAKEEIVSPFATMVSTRVSVLHHYTHPVSTKLINHTFIHRNFPYFS